MQDWELFSNNKENVYLNLEYLDPVSMHLLLKWVIQLLMQSSEVKLESPSELLSELS